MTILCIDGFNFLHRAKAGFNLGDYPVVFNFFRNLRALVEKHQPNRVYFVLEGHPQKRFDLLPEYKANRRIEGDPSDPEVAKALAEKADFFRQTDLIIDLLSRHFPVSVVRHPEHECDDVIFNLIRRSSVAVPWVVASNDTDFIQLLQAFPHVRLYNPMTKEFVGAPDYDYVTWKALRGDGSDNIPGLPGIGDKTAEELVNDPDKLRHLFEDKSSALRFSRNYQLIHFQSWTDDDALKMTSSSPTRDWDAVARSFDAWLFRSLLKEKTWNKYVATFEPLFGEPA